MINLYQRVENSGYISSGNDSSVSVAGLPASRGVWLISTDFMLIERLITSNINGKYIFIGLDKSKTYLVMARDHKKEYEPFVWDYVKPADDLTIAEQHTQWASWQ